MAKIYNEIVIDMNPESSTFEETLYEDSFEYNGDMYLAQSTYDEEWMTEMQSSGEQIINQGKYYKWIQGRIPPGYVEIDETALTQYGGSGAFIEQSDLEVLHGDYIDPNTIPVGEREDIGVPRITEADWMGKSLEQQAEYILKTKYNATPKEMELWNEEGYFDLDGDGRRNTKDISKGPGIGDDLYALLGLQPLKGEIDPTKAGFISEEYGGGDVSFADSLAGRTAGQTLGMGLDTLQGTAGKVSGAMQNVYGGSGIGMRAGIAGQEALATGLETAYEEYGLERDRAGLDYRKKIYGLEEDVTGAWETDWKSFWSSLPEATG